jgi:hypothetical protein
VANKRHWLLINRAPVLTLWTAVVAERLGFNKAEALTLGRAVSGLNAYSKGKSIGIFKPNKTKISDQRRTLSDDEVIYVDLMGRAIPTKSCDEGSLAIDKGKPISPDSVERYLEKKFGDALKDTRSAMERLARAYRPKDLADQAFALYARFRPNIPSGKKGWGAQGRLSLDEIRKLGSEA